MNIRIVPPGLLLGIILAPFAMSAGTDCQAPATLTLRVRFANEAPRDVLLQSNLAGRLVLNDPQTGRALWSASAGADSTQRIPGLDTTFGASVVALHLDHDGLHDRLYAGDRAGRLWRFDLRAGARPSDWMRAGILADLSVPGGGRGFVAAPDVTRIEIPGVAPWLNIAIGTANTGTARTDHRFYVLRDVLDAALPASPLTEAVLERLVPSVGNNDPGTPGYFLPLGSSQVLAQALTLNGLIHFTTVESGHDQLRSCAAGTLPTAAVAIAVTIIRAEDGAVTMDRDGNGHIDEHDLRRPLPRSLPANASVMLARVPRADGRLQCAVADDPLPECSLDTRPQRTWWRREDAD